MTDDQIRQLIDHLQQDLGVGRDERRWQTLYALVTYWTEHPPDGPKNGWDVDVVQEAARDLVVLGDNPVNVAMEMATIYGNLQADRLRKWLEDLQGDPEGHQARQRDAESRLRNAPVVYVDPKELKR